jgi:hypothetical protein
VRPCWCRIFRECSRPLADHAATADLVAFLKALPEARKRRSVRYPQWLLLLMEILDILSGCRSATGIWSDSPSVITMRSLQPWIWSFPRHPETPPSSTFFSGWGSRSSSGCSGSRYSPISPISTRTPASRSVTATPPVRFSWKARWCRWSHAICHSVLQGRNKATFSQPCRLRRCCSF